MVSLFVLFSLLTSPIALLQLVVSSSFLVNQIKQRLPTKPTRTLSSDDLVGLNSIRFRNLNSLSSSVGHKLHLAALLHAHEPEDTTLNCLSGRQDAVVSKQNSLSVSKSLGDLESLLLLQHDTIELLVNRMVVVERTRVLGDDIKLLMKGAESSSVDGVSVSSAVDIGSSMVNSGVNCERSSVQNSVRAGVGEDSSLVVDMEKARGGDQGKVNSEGVNPEGSWVDGVTNGDVTGNSLVESLLCEDAVGSSKTLFEVLPLGELVGEDGRLGEGHLDALAVCAGGLHHGAGRDLIGDFGVWRGHFGMCIVECGVILGEREDWTIYIRSYP